jgi:glycosyltransferase involved in cell wall biosynthesis
MDLLALERGLLDRWPVIKFMHGYLGTCIGGQKRFGFPTARPCDRRFGLACVALYGPRHCGGLKIGLFLRHYEWSREQHRLLGRYEKIVVASEHMRREYLRNGARSSQVEVNPLFPTNSSLPARRPGSDGDCVAFVGRMTVLKGGDLLVEAVAEASSRLGRPISLLLMGDGPQRSVWERLASTRGVPCTSTGWLNGDDRWTSLARAAVLAVPSTWPEPFGLVGLEAAALGVPAIAFDVGGIREWLRPGVNGCLVPADPPRSDRFADALVRMLSDPEGLEAMGRRAEAVAREMSIDRHLDRLESLFAQRGRTHAAAALGR